MRLIDVPNGSIFRLHDNLVLKTEYFSRVDDVYIPDCYIIGTGERFCGGMKTKDDFKTKFNDLEVEVINVLPDVSDTSSDTISRQAAIDALDDQIKKCCKALGSFSLSDVDKHAVEVEMESLRAYREMLENLPTVQQEPTDEQVLDYCKKRDLHLVTYDLFQSIRLNHKVSFGDKDHVWIDGKQYISLPRFQEAVKEAGPKEGEWVQIQRCARDAQPDLECPFCKYKIGWFDMGRYCAGCGAKLKGGAG